MAKRLTREQKMDQAITDLINEMFKIAGHSVTFEDVIGRKDDWFNEWTMTTEQYDEWQKFGKGYLRKTLNMTAKGADREMAMVGLMWGLKFKKDEDESSNVSTTVDVTDKL